MERVTTAFTFPKIARNNSTSGLYSEDLLNALLEANANSIFELIFNINIKICRSTFSSHKL